MEINQEISLETELPFQSVQDFTMNWEINEHAWLELNGILRQDHWDKVCGRDYVGTEIAVFLADSIEQSTGGALFRGIIRDVKLLWGHGVGMARIAASSASIKLDEEEQRLCRSFQNPSLSYADAAKLIAETGGGKLICTVEKKEIERPFICYRETIWEFLKRLASCQGAFLVPDIKTGRPNLWYGMRSGKQIDVDLAGDSAWVHIHKRYGNGGKSRAVKTIGLERRASYSLGDWAVSQGETFVIHAAEAKMDRGDITFSYQMSPQRDLVKKPYYNEAFTGLSLWCTVKETKNEAVRVAFDIDNEEGEWFFPWRPETGNALYAMPETGARAAVCFANHNEGSGFAVRCSGQPPENQEPKDKSIVIPADGKIELFTGRLNFRKKDEILELNDSSGIDFRGGRMGIEAVGKVKLQAAQISLDAVTEIKATTE